MGLRRERGAREQVRPGVAAEVGSYCLDRSQKGVSDRVHSHKTDEMN